MKYIVCDIGGSTTRVASASEEGLTSDPILFPTEQNFDTELDLLKKHIASFDDDQPIQRMVVGVPGSLNKDKSAIHRAPHVPDWNGKPIRDQLADAFKTPVFLESDAALVGLGEAVYGAGKGNDIVAYITVSTGVGGARIVHGKIDAATYGFEPGHQLIAIPNENLPHCLSCTTAGHLEAFIGGESLHHRHGEGRLRDILTESEKHILARHLATGLYNMMLFWSPGIVVLGGGLVVHNVVNIEEVTTQIQKINSILPEIPSIIKGELRDVGGLYGGIAYLNNG